MAKQRKPAFEIALWVGLPILVVVLLMFSHRQFDPDLKAPPFPTSELSIRLASGAIIPFHVEIATTPQQHAYGLMFRKNLPPQSGMLFLWDDEEDQTFWMKNTLIPLDMLFVRRDGVIANIASDRQPLDLTPVPSDGPVLAVLEIGGGEAARIKIAPGDQLLYPAFGSLSQPKP